METQDIALKSEACLSLKKRVLTSLWEDLSPLLTEVLKLSRHPTEEDAILELSRSELLFVALLQALRTKNAVMSVRLLLEMDEWKVLPRLSFYLGQKLNVEFNCPGNFFSSAAEFAHILKDCGLFRVPEKILDFLDHLAECMRKEIAAKSSKKQGAVSLDLQEECTGDSKEENASLERGRRVRYRRRKNSETSSSQQVLSTRPKVEDATEALMVAVNINDCEAVISAIQRGADIEKRDLYGWTPLNRPAFNGYVEVLGVLLMAGAELGSTNNDGDTAIHLATINGKVRAVSRLLEAGADLHAAGGRGRTPLHWAASRGHLELMDILIKAGADIEAVSRAGNRPLHLAACNGRDSAVARLVKAGADLHSKGERDCTPQECAEINHHPYTASLLRSLAVHVPINI